MYQPATYNLQPTTPQYACENPTLSIHPLNPVLPNGDFSVYPIELQV